MRYEILKSVAMPPKLFWAPFIIAVINLIVQFTFMIFGIVFLQVNPLVFVFSIIIVHAGIVAYGAKEPHLSKILVSSGKVPHSSKNMYSSKGVKLAS